MPYILLILTLLIIPLSVQAEEYIYDKPNCEFTMTFPGDVYESRRCNPENYEDCQTLTSYTQVFDMSASMNFKLSCNPVKEDMYARYSGDVMKTTLTALARSKNVDEHKTFFEDYPDVKQAVIIGTGKTGTSPKLYMGQMWIGKNSLMVVEGELVGEHVDPYEKDFASVLSSVRHKSWTSGTPPAGSDNPDAENDAPKDGGQEEEPAEETTE